MNPKLFVIPVLVISVIIGVYIGIMPSDNTEIFKN